MKKHSFLIAFAITALTASAGLPGSRFSDQPSGQSIPSETAKALQRVVTNNKTTSTKKGKSTAKAQGAAAAAAQNKAEAIVESVRQQYSQGAISADDVVNLAMYHKVWSLQVAEQCLRLVADSGNPKAMTALGALYTHYTTAYLFPGRAAEGVQLLENAARSGDSEAYDYLGIYYQLNNDFKKATGYFKAGGPENSARGNVIIGGMYEDGTGVKKDYAEAREHYRKAALKGDPSGASKYGYSLQRERFGTVSFPDAFFWLYIAGDLGDDAARTNLYLPRRGQRFGDDFHTMLAQKSFETVEKGRKGMTIATDPLYREGFIPDLKNRENKAEQGDDWARFYLGSMNYNGDFLNQNYARAIYYYEPIVKNGKLPASLLAVVYERLGDMYRNGKGVKADAAKGTEYTRKAAGYGSLAAYKQIEKVP